ncbi:MAG: type VI secretion system tube protein Hcp [Bdellovibrionota bacterium]
MFTLHGYMKFPTIKGTADSDNYKDWFHIDAYSFSIMNEPRAKLQSRNNPANYSSIMITRTIDDASSQIMGAVDAMDIGDCTIIFSKSSSEDAHPTITINLKNAQLYTYQTEVTKEGVTTEKFSIHYGAIQFEYSPLTNKSKQKPGHVFSRSLNK